jgi:hypothetical protein
MNAALGFFVSTRMDAKNGSMGDDGPNREQLRDCFGECREAIDSGAAFETLKDYVSSTGGTLR